MSTLDDKPLPKFNKQDLVPKQETQVLNFLKKNPTFNGSKTLVAILDTGVDPGAAGLQVTSEGLPKIVDLVDCTGSGDVILSKDPVALDGDNLTGLTGKILKLSSKLSNPTSNFYLGIKKLYDLYPDNVVSRIKETAKELKERDNSQLLEKVHKELAALPDSREIKDETETDRVNERRAELEAQLKVLNYLKTQFSESTGPMVDVVSYHDGTNHRVLVDWLLNECKPLTDYFLEREYWPVNYNKPPYEMINVSVKVYDEGKLISLVSSAGSHATHVAGILASHHPENTELDGVAPGAQLISLKIGDTRLGSMETQIGLTRAIATMYQHKVDLANMSYGEATKLPNQGRFVKWLQDEIIRRFNCIFVSSAGNEGPALSTCGAPGGTSSDVIGVGAYVSHRMMTTDYSNLEFTPEMAYSWSSRGPTTDGDVGVDIYAPGGAITSVPTYQLYKTQLMNGTSMSSPNLCGCLALLVSGLKHKEVVYTSYRVQNAIKTTAKLFKLRDNLEEASSAGIIQVDDAFNHLIKYKDATDLDVRIQSTVLNHASRRGIYLRESEETSAPFFASLRVDPIFYNDDSIVFGKNMPQNKFDYELFLSLQANQSFITTPEVLAFNNATRNITVKVDPTCLEAGKVHYGEVLGYDSINPEKGALLRIPVTVIKPIQLKTPQYALPNFKVSSGSIVRRFITVPEGATHCDLKVTTLSQSRAPTRLMVHLVQLSPQERFTYLENSYVLSFNPDSNNDLDGNGIQTEYRRFSVVSNRTLEICIVQFWSNSGDQTLDFNFDFHGVGVTNYTNHNQNIPLILDAASNTHKLDLISNLRAEAKSTINVTLNKLQKALQPVKATIAPLGSLRDQLPPNDRRLYQLVLDYTFSISQLELPATFRLKYPSHFQQYLYDSALDGFFVTILDAFNQPIGYDEVTPRVQTVKHKGDYLVKLQLNHIDPAVLENVKASVPNISIIFNLPQSSESNVSVSNSPFNTFTKEGSAVSKLTLKKNISTPVYLKAPQLPSNVDAKPGDLLVGKLNLGGRRLLSKDQLNLAYVLAPKGDVSAKDKKSNDTELSEKQQLRLAELSNQFNLVEVLKEEDKKLEKLNEIYDKFISNEEDELIKFTAVKDILSKTVKLDEFDINIQVPDKNKELAAKLATVVQSEIDVYKVDGYFNSEVEKSIHTLRQRQRESYTLGLLVQYINATTNATKDNGEGGKDLKKLYKQVLKYKKQLPTTSTTPTYLPLAVEIDYLSKTKSYAVAFNKILDFLNAEFVYKKENMSKLKVLYKNLGELLEKMGFDKVWLLFWCETMTKMFNNSTETVLG